MLFNPDPTKHATEVCFPHKRDNVPQEPLTFDNNKIQSAPAQKHLDPKLDLCQHLHDKINIMKSWGLWEDFQWHSLEKAY